MREQEKDYSSAMIRATIRQLVAMVMAMVLVMMVVPVANCDNGVDAASLGNELHSQATN